MTDVPESHPRYVSLRMRDDIARGVERGVTSPHGLIAHGRGEAFDYMIGERTQPFAISAIRSAAAMLLRASHPVISVNGNTAVLVPTHLVSLSAACKAPLEVNIFHTSQERERAIERQLRDSGAEGVLLPTPDSTIDHIESNRKFVNPRGIAVADVVFVPLEDGDRCEALRKMDKEVITIDLNPMSRTSRLASVTIVDNVVRAMPLLLETIAELRSFGVPEIERLVSLYDNETILDQAQQRLRKGE